MKKNNFLFLIGVVLFLVSLFAPVCVKAESDETSGFDIRSDLLGPFDDEITTQQQEQKPSVDFSGSAKKEVLEEAIWKDEQTESNGQDSSVNIQKEEEATPSLDEVVIENKEKQEQPVTKEVPENTDSQASETNEANGENQEQNQENNQTHAENTEKGEMPNSIIQKMTLQRQVSDVGLKLLNANKIDKRMIFVYNAFGKKPKFDKSVSKKEVVVYDSKLMFVNDYNELAALLSIDIGKTIESYKGFFTSLQEKFEPKKFELMYDKRAVDYMVTAGFHPVALITFINKSYPRQADGFYNSNSVTKRLANIYEYIYTTYPYYLKNNPYIYTESYQNFLLNSIENRKLLQEKIESGSKKKLNYE